MPYTFRRDQGTPLTEAQFDGNTDQTVADLATMAADIAALGTQVNIASFDFSVPGFVSVTMSDATVLGPYAFEAAAPMTFDGAWQALHVYSVETWFTQRSALYRVKTAHTSDATFDPAAGGGTYYQKLLDFPAVPSIQRTGTTFAPSLQDANTYNRCTNSGGCVVTIQEGIPFPLDTEMHFRVSDSCPSVALTGDTSAVIIEAPFGFSSVADLKGAVVSIKKVAEPSTWDMFGLMSQAAIPFAGLFVDTDSFHAPTVS